MIYGTWNEISAKLWLNRTDRLDEVLKEQLAYKATYEGYKIAGDIIIDDQVFYFRYTEEGMQPCQATDEYAIAKVTVRAEIK